MGTESPTPGDSCADSSSPDDESPIGALFLELSYEAPPNVELNPTGAPRSRLARKAREPHLVRRAGGLTPALAREERLSV